MAKREEKTNKSRRKFLATAGKAAVVVPATSVLLSAHSKSALAQVASGRPPRPQQPPRPRPPRPERPPRPPRPGQDGNDTI